MKEKSFCPRYLRLAIFAILVLPELASAQYFAAKQEDLLLGFRKTGANQGANEMVVNLGGVTNFLALSAGTTISISRFSPSQLSDAFSDYNDLQWSVSAAYYIGSPGSLLSGFDKNTIWFTLPRGTVNAQTLVPPRSSTSLQANAAAKIYGIGTGAYSISSSGNGATNADNNTTLVIENVNNPYFANSSLTHFIQDPFNSSLADFNGNINFGATGIETVENTTLDDFTLTSVSDLYQCVPNGSVDPNTGATSGNAYYVGYFTLDSSGAMTFTRASVAAAQPPAPQIVRISRSTNTSTIYFTTTNGNFTYSLYYTNSIGLKASVTNWPSSPTTIMGDGNTNSLSDISTDTNRFYRVGVH